ncbi:MAG: hypothetical protein QF567_00420 [Candidatus Pacearchaeota archaeon]|jgi:hypothetical protein|nr:hypothetical protein [Candidatus Pacearchaeota archaeon]MDP7520685.1 hypothetical protein [Candidatus Pacearchaeota archaeon]|tara:strand:- start:2083 stop:2472 length:390 start_codon:yes stop_codon:yes gene_type:complete
MKLKNNRKKDEDTIHIKIDYNEALQSKKDILLSEMNLLKVIKIIKKYHSSRMNELKLKLKLYKKIKGINIQMKKLQNALPKTGISNVLKEKKSFKKIKNKKISRTKDKKKDNAVESQLKDIQNKLNSLN